MAKRWAEEIAGLVREHGRGNTRLAADRLNPEGFEELTALGISAHNSEEVMELARSSKHHEEIKAMRCAIAATETSMRVI